MDYNKQREFSKGCKNNALKKLNTMDLSDVDINYSFDRSTTPINSALKLGHIDVVSFLIENGADLSLEDINGFTPAMIASQNNYNDIVEKLANYGDHVDIDLMKQRQFLLACKSSDLKSAIELSCNVGVDIQDKFGRTPISYAAQNADIELIELLIQKGANPNIQDIYSTSPLEYACCRSENPVMVIQNMQVVCLKDNTFDCVKLMVNGGAEIDYKNIAGETALILSSRKCRSEVVNFLLQSGADIQVKDNKGFTALMMASGACQLKSMESLIKCNADLNVRNNDGDTALMRAVMFNHIDAVKMLIESGADITIHDNSVCNISTNIAIKFLLNNKIINEKDKNGDTLLMISCQDKKEYDILFLHERGADFHIKNNDGQSAYSILKRKKALSPALQALKESLILNMDAIEYDITPGGSL